MEKKKSIDKPLVIAEIVGKWVGGGVESVLMNYYRNIDKTKIQFDFICDSDSTNIPYKEIEKLGGKVILVPPYQKVFKYQKALKKVLINGNYKIVHSHINTLSVFSLYVAKKAKIPVRIAHSHSTTSKKEWKRNILKKILRPFVKCVATDYMCCSEYAGRWLFGDKEYDKGKVYLLNNAIDIDKFIYNEKIRKNKRNEFKIDDDTLVIGHIGRFVEQKNHRFLIDIFDEIHKKNPNSILLMAGDGPLINEIKTKVSNLGLSNSVKFLGQRDDANELYQAFDVFLLPSLYEGLGMVLIEAQVCGLNCAVSDAVPISAKISNNISFLSLEEKSSAWAENIIKSLKNNNREVNLEQIDKLGYNIIKETKKLEEKYMEFSNS